MFIKLVVSYDGTNYSGFQSQKNAIGIMDKISYAFFEIYKKDIKLNGASRTDTGVHAMCNVISCEVPDNIKCESLLLALNTKLPLDIRIMDIKQVSKNFHARYNVISKTYQYTLSDAKVMLPFNNRYVTHIKYNLDVDKMNEACGYLVGTHDFTSFCSIKTETKTNIRTIYELEAIRDDDIITITITGNGFLYNMVRIIVGTLVDIGRGKILPEKIVDILEKKDRKFAGVTMPPQGLCLVYTEYEE